MQYPRNYSGLFSTSENKQNQFGWTVEKFKLFHVNASFLEFIIKNFIPYRIICKKNVKANPNLAGFFSTSGDLQ